MATSIFLSGRNELINSLLEPIEEAYDDPRIIVYSVDHFKKYYTTDAIKRVFYDKDIGNDTSGNPDMEYLQSYEKTYGTNSIWQAISTDRRLFKDGYAGQGTRFHSSTSRYTYDEILQMVEEKAKTIEYIFGEYDFEFVFAQSIGHVCGFLTYLIAEEQDVPFFRTLHTQISNRMSLFESLYEYSEQILNAFEYERENPGTLDRTAAKELIDEVQEGGTIYYKEKPPRMQNQYEDRNLFDKIVDGLPTLFAGERPLFGSDYYFEPSRATLKKAELGHKIRKHYQSINSPFDDDRFDPTERFVYFPLHAQPELATMVWARYYDKFPPIIRNIAQSLPVGMELYVNEHPEMSGYRSSSYYDNLRHLPNVKVFSRDISTYNLIQESECIITIASSVGLRALMLETPVATFGNVAHNTFETTNSITNITELPSIIKDTINMEVDMDEVEAYVAACMEIGIPKGHPERNAKFVDYIKRSTKMSEEQAWREALNNS